MRVAVFLSPPSFRAVAPAFVETDANVANDANDSHIWPDDRFFLVQCVSKLQLADELAGK